MPPSSAAIRSSKVLTVGSQEIRNSLLKFDTLWNSHIRYAAVYIAVFLQPEQTRPMSGAVETEALFITVSGVFKKNSVHVISQ